MTGIVSEKTIIFRSRYQELGEAQNVLSYVIPKLLPSYCKSLREFAGGFFVKMYPQGG